MPNPINTSRLCAISLFFLATLLPTTLLSVDAAPAWLHDQTDLSPDPAVTWGTLPNGVRWVHMPNSEPPGRTSLRLLVHAGSLHETEPQRGLAHFLEHMAFNGTTHFAPGEMVEYFQRLGMAFGPDTNAHTWWRETVYKLELPESTPALFADAFKLLRDYADGMLLLDNEIEDERGIILAEKRSRDSVEARAFEEEINYLIPGSLPPRRLPIGLETVIKEAPRSEFADFYKTWYRADRLTLIAVGEMTREAFAAAVEEWFGSMEAPAEPLLEPSMGSITPRGLTARVHRDPEAQAVSLSLQTAFPVQEGIDSRERRIERMVRSIAAGILSRRLEELAKASDAPFTRGSAYSYPWLDFAHFSGIELTCPPDNWRGSLQLAEQELRRSLDFGFTSAELEEARARFKRSLEDAVNQASTRRSRNLSSSLVRAISDRYVFLSPEQERDLLLPALEELTPSDLHIAWKSVWNFPSRLIWVSGNLPTEGNRESDVMATFLASSQNEVSPPVEVDLPPWGYADLGSSQGAAVLERQDLDDLGIIRLRLANEVRISLKQTDFEAGVVHLALRFGHGKLTLPVELPGLDLAAEALFIEGGTVKHDIDQMRKILAGRTYSTNFSIESDAFVLSGRTNAEDFALQAQVLAAYLTDPAFRPEALQRAFKSFAERYQELRHTPIGILQNKVVRFMAGEDHRFGYPPLEDLEKRQPEEVRQWLDRSLKEDFLEIAVVGDFQSAQVLPVLQRIFGALPARASTKPRLPEARLLNPPPASSKPVSFPFTSSIPKAISMLVSPTTDMWDIQRTRRLNLLTEVLSDRLRVKIREEIGEAYSPFALHRPSDTYQDFGNLLAIIICDPAQVDSLGQLLHNIAEDLHQDGVNSDELERALVPQLKQIEELRRNNSYWLNNVLLPSWEYPIRLDWARSMENDIANITTEDLTQLARSFLDPANAHIIHIIATPQP